MVKMNITDLSVLRNVAGRNHPDSWAIINIFLLAIVAMLQKKIM